MCRFMWTGANILPTFWLLLAFLSIIYANETIKLESKAVIHKCYQATFPDARSSSSSPKRDLSKSGVCWGEHCATSTHLQSKAVRYFCLNSTNDLEVELVVGECRNIVNGVPDQVERVCLCSGDLCNDGKLLAGEVSSSASSHSFLTKFTATVYKMTLGSGFVYWLFSLFR